VGHRIRLAVTSVSDLPPTDSIRALVRTLLEQLDVAGRSELLAQVEGIEYIDGPVTMMRLRVSRTYAPARGVPSPLPNMPTVVDQDGEPIGMLILWLDDAGYIDCLEYAWVTDEKPTRLPGPDRLVPGAT
jgi:hypothetical protein